MGDFKSWKEYKTLMGAEDFSVPQHSAEPDHAGEDGQEKNKQGGFDPRNEEEIKKFKHADLITLPVSVSGTNCGNCQHFQGHGNAVGYCDHHDILQNVTSRMCCVYWNHSGVSREWGEMSTHEE